MQLRSTDGNGRAAEEAGLDRVELMTLLVVIMFGTQVWFSDIPTKLLALVGIFFSAYRLRFEYWYALLTLYCCGIVFRWDAVDNHKFLLAYWLFALTVTRSLEPATRAQELRRAARWLLALSMVLAAVWKLRTIDFMDGTFFVHALLFDSRFEFLATRFGVSSKIAYEAHFGLWMAEHFTSGTENAALSLSVPSVLRRFALFMTYWSVAIELGIGLGYCIFPRVGRALLVTFVVTTYPFARVVGFGTTLCLLASMEAPSNSRWPAIFAILYLLVFSFLFPWEGLASPIFDMFGGT